MHLADTFIQSDLQCIQAIQYFFCQCCAMKWLLTLNSQQQFKLNRKKKSEHMEVGEDRKIVGVYRTLKLHFGQKYHYIIQ